VLTRKAAKSAHSATTDIAEHAFAATGIYSYRPNIISSEDFQPSEVACEEKIPDEHLRLKTGIQMLTFPFVSLVLSCLYLPLYEHMIIELLPESTAHTSMEEINPLPKASVEVKLRKIKSRKSEILPGTPNKICIEIKGKEKVNKMKVRTDRQLKRLEAQHETEESVGLK
jgi:hypothetical protein